MKKILIVLAILFATGLNSSRAQDTWTQKADFGGTARDGAVGFSIGSKGYIGTGDDGTVKNDFWEYDPSTDAWTQMANFGGLARTGAAGFNIGNKGYIGTGGFYDAGWHYYNDFWEYDPATNAWIQKADFVTGRIVGMGFSIGNKGYMGTGLSSSGFKRDFWEYDPATDFWTQKTDFGGTARNNEAAFSIDNKGYVGTGYDGTYTKDFWEYDPSINTWTQKANFGGVGRAGARGFSIGTKGYIGTGTSVSSDLNDFWEYDPSTNTWEQKADVGGTHRRHPAVFSIGTKGYIGTGNDYTGTNNWQNDFWEYTPGTSSCAVPTNLSATNITSSSAKLKWDAVPGAEGYKIRYKVANTSAWTKKDTYNPSKTINGLSPNTTYQWQVQTFCETTPPHVKSEWSSKQTFTTAEFKVGEALDENDFDVDPNPFTSSTTISFSLQQPSQVTIELFEVAGRKLQTLLNENTEAANHQVTLHRDQLSEGIYFIKLSINGEVMTRKVLVQ